MYQKGDVTNFVYLSLSSASQGHRTIRPGHKRVSSNFPPHLSRRREMRSSTLGPRGVYCDRVYRIRFSHKDFIWENTKVVVNQFDVTEIYWMTFQVPNLSSFLFRNIPGFVINRCVHWKNSLTGLDVIERERRTSVLGLPWPDTLGGMSVFLHSPDEL